MSKFRSSVLAAITGALLAGCASSNDYDDAEYRVAEEKRQNDMSCSNDMTKVCEDRAGKRVRCYCENKDELEHMLDDPYGYDERP